MLSDLQQAIEGLRFLMMLLQTDDLDAGERDMELERIVTALEFAAEQAEASQ